MNINYWKILGKKNALKFGVIVAILAICVSLLFPVDMSYMEGQTMPYTRGNMLLFIPAAIGATGLVILVIWFIYRILTLGAGGHTYIGSSESRAGNVHVTTEYYVKDDDYVDPETPILFKWGIRLLVFGLIALFTAGLLYFFLFLLPVELFFFPQGS